MTDGGGLDDVGVLGGASAFVLLVVVEDCGVVEDVAGGAGVDADDREVAAADGVLDVDDADRLRSALTEGMGRAKGYGCGLMTLRQVGG